MMTNVGSVSLSAREAANLRDYLLKGGFVWADDFWGSAAWDWWEAQLRPDVPLRRREFPAHRHAAGPSLVPRAVRGSGARRKSPTSATGHAAAAGRAERRRDSAIAVHTRAIVDPHGRIMVLSAHNTDLGDSFEREGDDPELLPGDVGAWLRVWHQHAVVRDDSLNCVRRA